MTIARIPVQASQKSVYVFFIITDFWEGVISDKKHSLAPITGIDIPGSFFGGDDGDGELSTNMGTEGLGGVMLKRQKRTEVKMGKLNLH